MVAASLLPEAAAGSASEGEGSEEEGRGFQDLDLNGFQAGAGAAGEGAWLGSGLLPSGFSSLLSLSPTGDCRHVKNEEE